MVYLHTKLQGVLNFEIYWNSDLKDSLQTYSSDLGLLQCVSYTLFTEKQYKSLKISETVEKNLKRVDFEFSTPKVKNNQHCKSERKDNAVPCRENSVEAEVDVVSLSPRQDQLASVRRQARIEMIKNYPQSIFLF